MTLDLICLHDCGAEVAGEHGDAWLRQQAALITRKHLFGDIRDAHARLGRRVVVGDLTGAPTPQTAAAPGGISVPFASRSGGTVDQRLLINFRRHLQAGGTGALQRAAEAIGLTKDELTKLSRGFAPLTDPLRAALRSVIAAPSTDQPKAPTMPTRQPADPACLTDLRAALDAFGPGGRSALARACGLDISLITWWLRDQSPGIPADRVAAVRAWLTSPREEHPTTPAPKREKPATVKRTAPVAESRLIVRGGSISDGKTIVTVPVHAVLARAALAASDPRDREQLTQLALRAAAGIA